MNPTHIPKEILLPDWACQSISGTKGDCGHCRFDSMPINLYCWTFKSQCSCWGLGLFLFSHAHASTCVGQHLPVSIKSYI